ncbi:MAG: phosphate ABC transporter substrate-binding protein PstS, partial [Frankiales bacterium]|nr:phosphate ABC transporter substrate-binding protein PstS [Frankiales bacterium]
MIRPTRRAVAAALITAIAATGLVALAPVAGAQESYVPISGAGSTWSQNAIDQWRRNVNKFGMRVNYQGTGSSDGRNQFRNGTVDYAVSEIPYGLSDGGVVDTPPGRKYAYMPIVAGGTSFMYNLKIGGQRVTNIRLSGPTIAAMFTGAIKRWDDPAVKADNPGLALPARQVVPVVRSDGSGTTAQFSSWLANRHAGVWNAYCEQAGRKSPCGTTSNYPVVPGKGFVAQSGSLGVAGYVAQSQSEGAITYVEYSYALNSGFPVAKVLNDAGFYVEPTASNVAVALLNAKINEDANSPQYLTSILDGVYANSDKRSYQLSSYSYMVLPTQAEGTFNTSKGKTLGDFAYYFLCEGQQQAPALGFSPLPLNLVQAGLNQVRKIPGVDAKTVDISKCNNPTFSTTGENTLAKNAPPPQACDAKGATQCGTGTGGAKQATVTRAQPAAGSGPSSSTSTTPQTGSAGAAPTTTASGSVAAGSGGAPLPGLTAAGTPGTVVDADGVVVAAPSGDGAVSVAAGGDVVGVPVSLSDRSTGAGANVLMGLAVLVLAAVTLLPPLL